MGQFTRLADLLLVNDLDTSLRLLDKVAGSDNMLEIPRGRVEGQSVVNKFGANEASAQDAVEVVWDGG
ncbi:unnamed protein product, partial [marine sediment metagenome]